MNQTTDSSKRRFGLAQRFTAMSPRARGVIGGVVSVVVLAMVIFGVSALSAPKSSRVLDSGLSAANTGEDARYDQALTALRAGETTTAVSLLEEVLLENPGDKRAQSLLDSISGSSSDDTDESDSSSSSSETDGSGASSGTSNDGNGEVTDPDTSDPEIDESQFDAPTDDLVALLPRSAQGFSLGAKMAVEDNATVTGSPSDGDMLTSRAIWTVYYRGSKEEAAAFIDDVSRKVYPDDQKTVTIDGASAFFGTDGTRFATIVYTRGRYVFELTLTTLSGVPAALRNEAVEAAQAFPDTM